MVLGIPSSKFNSMIFPLFGDRSLNAGIFIVSVVVFIFYLSIPSEVCNRHSTATDQEIHMIRAARNVPLPIDFHFSSELYVPEVLLSSYKLMATTIIRIIVYSDLSNLVPIPVKFVVEYCCFEGGILIDFFEAVNSNGFARSPCCPAWCCGSADRGWRQNLQLILCN